MELKVWPHLKAVVPFPNALCSSEVDFPFLLQCETKHKVTTTVQQLHIFKLTKFDLKNNREIKFLVYTIP